MCVGIQRIPILVIVKEKRAVIDLISDSSESPEVLITAWMVHAMADGHLRILLYLDHMLTAPRTGRFDEDVADRCPSQSWQAPDLQRPLAHACLRTLLQQSLRFESPL